MAARAKQERDRWRLRGESDDLPQNWWFASTAIPLVAATIGPMANVMSIAALVTKWRVSLLNDGQLPEGADDNGINIPDPRWEIILNAISLACGFFGNICLLFNFTKRVRYIVALPLTIISWFFATGILLGIIVAVNTYFPPITPGETYSQGYWYAIIATVLYMIGAAGLIVNIIGYFLGHYSQHFELNDEQRTLILQTMMFFIWLAGGAGVFSTVMGISYANALYFCDVTILTVGFGDFSPDNGLGRALVMPYAVIGIIFLGLMIKSIREFAVSISNDKIVKSHQLRTMERTADRTVTSEHELRERLGLPPCQASDARNGLPRQSLSQYGKLERNGHGVTFVGRWPFLNGELARKQDQIQASRPGSTKPLDRKHRIRLRPRKERLYILKEEKDVFDKMRTIQQHTKRFRQYYSLSISTLAFALLWLLGAVVFWKVEHREQNLSYFEALYFCYISLITIGYGDVSPKSNLGKPFFVVWSLIAVPTITLLISDMGDTVVSGINRGTFTLADWTVLPKDGLGHDLCKGHSKIRDYLDRLRQQHDAEARIEDGFGNQNCDDVLGTSFGDDSTSVSLEALAKETPGLTEHDLARKLALSIKRVANDLRTMSTNQYSFEEWVEFTRLIRFSGGITEEAVMEEEEKGSLNWDWLSDGSPMLAEGGESEWVLNRLCESLDRYTLSQSIKDKKRLETPDHLKLDSTSPGEQGEANDLSINHR